jgi:hypothetical protein
VCIAVHAGADVHGAPLNLDVIIQHIERHVFTHGDVRCHRRFGFDLADAISKNLHLNSQS